MSKEDWYTLFISILNSVRARFRKSTHCVFFDAYINFSETKKKWRCLAILVELTTRKLNFFDSYALWMLKESLEEHLDRDDNDQDKILKLIVDFENKLDKFHKAI